VSVPAGTASPPLGDPAHLSAVVVEPTAVEGDSSPYEGAAALLLTTRRMPPAQPGGTIPVPRVVPHLLETLRSFLSVIVVALFVLTFIVQPFRIPSESMERTLLVGDFLLVNKMAESPEGRWWFWALPYRAARRGDVIVFHFPAQPSEHLVKRVVAIPGDRLRLIDGTLYVNGKAQLEPYAIYRGGYPDSFRDQFPDGAYTDPGVDARWWLRARRSVKNGELVVPKDSYFVLGDNRNNSRDSRYWGFVPRENIVGRPFVIYFSIRGISPTDPSPLPGDALARGNSLLSALLDFARWERMFQIVR
jgi:signal peptidase I